MLASPRPKRVKPSTDRSSPGMVSAVVIPIAAASPPARSKIGAPQRRRTQSPANRPAAIAREKPAKPVAAPSKPARRYSRRKTAAQSPIAPSAISAKNAKAPRPSSAREGHASAAPRSVPRASPCSRYRDIASSNGIRRTVRPSVWTAAGMPTEAAAAARPAPARPPVLYSPCREERIGWR